MMPQGDNAMRLITPMVLALMLASECTAGTPASPQTTIQTCKGVMNNVAGIIEVGGCYVQDNPKAFSDVASACRHGHPCTVQAGVIPRDTPDDSPQTYTVTEVYSARPTLAEPLTAAEKAERDGTCVGVYTMERVGPCHLMDVDKHGGRLATGGVGAAPGIEKVDRACHPGFACIIRARVVPRGEAVDGLPLAEAVRGYQDYTALEVYSARPGK
jgi:hypothetical protein